ncbi:ABC transporter permease [Flavobacterium hydatis]|jgi:putative ABC transport system permease protein|uniref:Multidrug ABC transporter substrate-binding protein n=1 Tax=Flavobacterium hydatis TaxID=991 RepID=A0A086A052_FLAHY|nr:ABC transporter permease [Flavobacterium hydatis]KFF10066.1 multidrug ABC transporter substrate-binding protein [Flavobacterium hydatis]OXA93298.1 multidrug ABC transporter substrate-binding protein [Flavobacterium hydatis]
MLKNWINIFFYQIKNNKFFTALNVLGLSIGIAGLIFATLYWNDEHSYDQWNPEKDKIYAVLNDIGGGNIWAVNSAVSAPILKKTSSALQDYCYFTSNYEKETIQYNGKIELVDKIFSAQSSFFSFFPYEFIQGNRKSALHDRNSMAISDELASRIFKNENPMGKQVKYAGNFFVIRGVYRLSKKSSVMPAAVTTIIQEDLDKKRDSWGLNFGLMLKLKNQSDTTAILKDLNNIYVENNFKKQAREEGITYETFLKQYGVPVKAKLLQFSSSRLLLGNCPFPEGNANLHFLKILMGLSILILLLSIVNYINLATANAVKRAKEVGVRKIVGATKQQIIAQFVFETALITLFSLLLALVIVELSLPFYNSILAKKLILEGAQFYVQLIFIFVLVILVAGVLPAIYVSNFEPLKVLKGNFSRSKSGIWLRNGMLVLQFAIATFFIIGSFIVYQQVNYMANKDLGFKGAQVMDISFKPKKEKNQYERYKTIKQELLKIKGVQAVSAGVFSIGNNVNSWSGMHYKDNKEVITQQMAIDFGMLDVLGVRIIKGRDLTNKIASDSISNVLLNEAAAKTLLEKDPINKEIIWESRKLKVVGVVNDFHYFGLQNEISPMIFMHITTFDWMQKDLLNISVKIAPEDMPKTIDAIEKFWKVKVDAEYPFEFNFVDKSFARTYKDYQNQSRLFSLLNVIVILIAVFGLFALASFSMERRLREIAIRKTLGAETNVLLKELSKQYVVFCVIGFIIGIIPAYLLLQQWLDFFAFRINIQVLPFIIAFVSLLFLTLTIVLAKAYQVTKIDVLRYLKYE